jgi:hypothetical protein
MFICEIKMNVITKPAEIKLNEDVIEWFNLFTIEATENYLTEMKESEMSELEQHYKTFSFKREDLEHYLDLRKGALFC